MSQLHLQLQEKEKKDNSTAETSLAAPVQSSSNADDLLDYAVQGGGSFKPPPGCRLQDVVNWLVAIRDQKLRDGMFSNFLADNDSVLIPLYDEAGE